MARPTPARDKALAFLRRLTRERIATGNHRLPVLGELAVQAGVSPVTMLKAVRALCGQGSLRTSHGRGTVVVPALAGSVTAAPAPQAAQPRPGERSGSAWRLRLRLERDIVDGLYQPGSLLPPTKELVQRYGVCHQTLQRALSQLTQTGRLLAAQRRHRVPDLPQSSGRDTVVLIALGNEYGSLQVISPRLEEHLRTLEREAARAGLRLAVYAWDRGRRVFHGPAARGLSLADVRAGGVVLGFLVWTMGYASEDMAHLLEALAASGRPVALLDEPGMLRLPEALLRRCRGRIFRLADDVAAAAQVGRYLVNLGHRGVAFVSPVHGAFWSQRRLNGLGGSLAAAGCRVSAYTLDKRGQEEFVSGLRGTLADEALRRVRSIVGGGHLALTYNAHTTHQTLSAAIEHHAMGVHLDRLLRHTLREPTISAWVAASDSVALLCLDFLKRHRRSVPGDISVVGFDDSLDAFINRLTSYNFNGSAAVHAMLRHVLDTQPGRGVEEPLVVEFQGFIAERSTVAGRPLRSARSAGAAPPAAPTAA